MTTRQFLIFII